MSTKSLSCKIIKQGRDTSGLLRFTRQRFRGKGGHTLIIKTFYRPCKPAKGAGYAQKKHLTRFNKINRDICPRQAMMDDLST